MRMVQHQAFDKKSILVIDKAPKNTNDRTWCFWEKEPGLFEPVVHHQWQQVHFFSNYFSSLIDLSPYHYKMIRGIDFYNFVFDAAHKNSNVTFLYGDVECISNESNVAKVVVNDETFTAQYIFNSILFSKPRIAGNKYYLLQHFKGLMIETTDAAFDPTQATLMDFRIDQSNGTSFMYVLPVSANKALIEYTLFTPALLPKEQYDDALLNYINGYLKLSNYKIVEEELGVIPMTNIPFNKGSQNIINIGTAGGQTKASTGYTFQFIQKQAQQIVDDLLLYGQIITHGKLIDRRFNLYDSTLLNILHHKKLGGDKIFAELFKKNKVESVLRFLDNESDLHDEWKIMRSLPQAIFLKAALQEIF
jgi:lycopene beta-cyclase